MTLRQEPEALDGRVLRRIGIAFVLATAFGVLLARALLGRSSHAASPGVAAAADADTTVQFRKMAGPARADARLRTYGWVDRDAGIVHVPVARAFELMAAAGRGGSSAVAGGVP